jgi:hypothetical protein
VSTRARSAAEVCHSTGLPAGIEREVSKLTSPRSSRRTGYAHAAARHQICFAITRPRESPVIERAHWLMDVVIKRCRSGQVSLGFFPTAFLPAFIAAPEGRRDVVQYTRLAGCSLLDSANLVTAKGWPQAKMVISEVLHFACFRERPTLIRIFEELHRRIFTAQGAQGPQTRSRWYSRRLHRFHRALEAKVPRYRLCRLWTRRIQTPSPPSFSDKKSIPAVSKATRIFSTATFETSRRSRSKSTTVERPKTAASAS